MKPEFSEILIPASKLQSAPSTESSIRLIGRSKGTENMNKCFITAAILFAFVVAIVTTAFIVRYEDKLSHYEFRISSLEKELSSIYEMWEEEYGPLHVSEKDFEYEIPTHSSVYGSDENAEDEYASKEEENQEVKLHEEKDLLGEATLEESRSRRKRQIPFTPLPTYGPNVQRTADGVPILESSYLDKIDSRPAAAAFSRFAEPATTDSEGLRLYEGLLATGGRNEPRSLDSGSFGHNGILPHHRTSASWSERAANRNSRSNSGIQLKSGDSNADLPSGFGASTGAQIGEDLTYGRASSYRRHTRTEKSRSSARGSTSRTSTQTSGDPTIVSPGSSFPAATYHRRSRVPATEDFLIPPAPSQLSTRSLQYPPLQRLGRGDGEVIARVVQNDNENDSEFPNGGAINGEANRRRQGSRRVSAGNSKRQNAYKQGRKHISDLHQPQYPLGTGSGDISIVKAEAWIESPGKPIAAHYVADVSNYNISHRHYEGNGRLRNVDGIFASWKPSDWMESTNPGEEKNFVLNQNGVLTIKKPGLYYIYAQIHYLDEHDINGYVVQVNTSPFLQCTTMTETQHAGSKSNSCFTAGITQLKENDRILVKDIETNRYSIFKPEKSFFGLMKLGDLQQ